MRTLLISAPMPERYFSPALREAHPGIDLLEYSQQPGDEALADVQAVLAWQLPPGIAARLPRLKWVCAVAAGVDKLLVPELPPQVMVSRIVDAEQAEGIAQFVVLMALRHARGLVAYEAQQRQHDWTRKPVAVVRSRVTVLGTGAMGAVVMAMLAKVGFDVRGWNRRCGQTLHEALRGSEIVVCALPLTPETNGLLDAAAFAAMPQGAYLINIARGAHVVEPDLMAALQGGHLAGAALDVQTREPLPADDPLWDTPGITITPHIAAQSSPRVIAEQFIAGLRCLERGEIPANTIDRARGY